MRSEILAFWKEVRSLEIPNLGSNNNLLWFVGVDKQRPQAW